MLTIGKREDVEGIELPFVIVLARVPGIEIGNAVYAEDDGLAIDDELLRPTPYYLYNGVASFNRGSCGPTASNWTTTLSSYGYRQCFRSHRRVAVQQRTV
jgi:hypothetical protein